MAIPPFKLERFFARYEFSAKYLLSSSDCESLSLTELVQMAAPDSLKLWQDLKLGYTESQGHPLLREEVAGMYAHMDPGQVVIAAPEELIYVAMQTLLSPGDHLVVVSPAYQSLYEVARSIGCDVTPWPLQVVSGKWQLDLFQLERSITPTTRLLVINFPHNPTGCLPSHAELEAIIELARQHDLYVFSDEMYRLLEYDPDQRLPAVCDIYEKGISLSGLSKSFALPGLRMGWLASRVPGLIGRFIAFKDYTTICNSAPGEILAIMALQNREAILQRNRAIVKDNIALAEGFFNRHTDQFRWLAPRAGSVAFPQWQGEGTVDAFCQALVEQQGVMIVPGSQFDHPGSHFRIGLGRRNFGEALGQVQEYFQRL